MKDILLAQLINVEDMVKDSTSQGINPEVVTDPSKAPKVKVLFYNLQLSILYIVGVLVVLSLIYGGFLYITSGGDSDKAERGKRVITGSIIAIIIVVGSLAIYTFATNMISATK